MAGVVRAAGLVVGGCVLAAALVVVDAQPAAPCSGAPVRLRVAASPEIASAVGRVAARFSAARPSVSGRCVTVSVTARPAASVATTLSRSAPGIDAWLPDSDTWADDVRRARGAEFLPDGPVVARTPVVFAVRDGHAAEARRDRLGWHSLVPSAIDTRGRATGTPFAARVPDPDGDSTGVAALSALRAATGGGTVGVTRLATAFAALGTVPPIPGDPHHPTRPGRVAGVIPGSGRSGARLVVVSEQGFWARTRHGGRATVVYPSDGSPVLDYRYLVSTGDEVRRRTAWAFGSALLDGDARREFAAAGFRPPDGSRAGFAARDGLDPGPFIALSDPDDRTTLRLRRMWHRHRQGTRLLIALDVSASMATPLPAHGTPQKASRGTASRAALPAGAGATPPEGDRLDVAVAGIRRWLAAMGDGDAAGLWTFATGLGDRPSVPYRQAAPMRPLDAGQRRTLDAALGSAAPRQVGRTGLYATVLAAYKRAERGARPGHGTAVVVVTDGRDTDPSGPSTARTLHRLAAAYDPHHPVDLSIVAFGPDVDASAIHSMAAAVHGTSWTTGDPAGAPDLLAAIPPHLACATTCP